MSVGIGRCGLPLQAGSHAGVRGPRHPGAQDLWGERPSPPCGYDVVCREWGLRGRRVGRGRGERARHHATRYPRDHREDLRTVADSGISSEANMRRFTEAQIPWISRVPQTSTEAKAVVEMAFEGREWHDAEDG